MDPDDTYFIIHCPDHADALPRRLASHDAHRSATLATLGLNLNVHFHISQNCHPT